MPFDMGAPELVVIPVIVVLLFGVGRVGQFGRELGSAIRQFREGLKGTAEGEGRPETLRGSVHRETPTQLWEAAGALTLVSGSEA